jgi:siroheme synthase
MVNIYPSTIHMIMGGERLSEFCKGIYRQEMGITRKTAMVALASSSSHNIWEFQFQKINNTIKIHFISQASPRLIKIGWVGNMGRGQAEK